MTWDKNHCKLLLYNTKDQSIERKIVILLFIRMQWMGIRSSEKIKHRSLVLYFIKLNFKVTR